MRKKIYISYIFKREYIPEMAIEYVNLKSHDMTNESFKLMSTFNMNFQGVISLSNIYLEYVYDM